MAGRKSVFTDEYRALVDRLVEARRAAGLTQAEVAQRLGRPQSYVAKVEGYQRRLDVVEFIELSEVLEINAATLIGQITTRKPSKRPKH